MSVYVRRGVMADSVDDSCELIESSNAPNVTTFQRIGLNGTIASDQYGCSGGSAGAQCHFHPIHVSVIRMRLSMALVLFAYN